MSALVRALLGKGNDLVTLGRYADNADSADNAAGRALHDVLGFVDDHRFAGGPLLVRGCW